VVNPAIPAPMMQTSALISWLKGFSNGVDAVAAHTESVVPEVGSIAISSSVNNILA